MGLTHGIGASGRLHCPEQRHGCSQKTVRVEASAYHACHPVRIGIEFPVHGSHVIQEVDTV